MIWMGTVKCGVSVYLHNGFGSVWATCCVGYLACGTIVGMGKVLCLYTYIQDLDGYGKRWGVGILT